jgi:hypothetical protein
MTRGTSTAALCPAIPKACTHRRVLQQLQHCIEVLCDGAGQRGMLPHLQQGAHGKIASGVAVRCGRRQLAHLHTARRMPTHLIQVGQSDQEGLSSVL